MTMAIPPLPTTPPNPYPYLKEETQDFLQYYRVQHIKSEHRCYVPDYFNDFINLRATDDLTASAYMRCLHTEQLVTITIPQSSLDTIIINDAAFKHIMQQSDPYNRQVHAEREHYLKRNNAGVRKAWDHYQLMLKLAWEGSDVG